MKMNKHILTILCLLLSIGFSQHNITIVTTGSVHGQLDPCG